MQGQHQTRNSSLAAMKLDMKTEIRAVSNKNSPPVAGSLRFQPLQREREREGTRKEEGNGVRREMMVIERDREIERARVRGRGRRNRAPRAEQGRSRAQESSFFSSFDSFHLADTVELES